MEIVKTHFSLSTKNSCDFFDRETLPLTFSFLNYQFTVDKTKFKDHIIEGEVEFEVEKFVFGDYKRKLGELFDSYNLGFYMEENGAEITIKETGIKGRTSVTSCLTQTRVTSKKMKLNLSKLSNIPSLSENLIEDLIKIKKLGKLINSIFCINENRDSLLIVPSVLWWVVPGIRKLPWYRAVKKNNKVLDPKETYQSSFNNVNKKLNLCYAFSSGIAEQRHNPCSNNELKIDDKTRFSIELAKVLTLSETDFDIMVLLWFLRCITVHIEDGKKGQANEKERFKQQLLGFISTNRNSFIKIARKAADIAFEKSGLPTKDAIASDTGIILESEHK